MTASFTCATCWPRLCVCKGKAGELYADLAGRGYWFEMTVLKHDDGHLIGVREGGEVSGINLDERRTKKAFEFADSHCLGLVEGECVPVDLDAGTWAYVDHAAREVSTLAEAGDAVREAVEWLLYRGLAEHATDERGQLLKIKAAA